MIERKGYLEYKKHIREVLQAKESTLSVEIGRNTKVGTNPSFKKSSQQHLNFQNDLIDTQSARSHSKNEDITKLANRTRQHNSTIDD